MGVYTDIESALNARLDSLSSHPPIAWPNTKYKPIEGTTYLRPTLLPAESDADTLNGGQVDKGIYQIDIFVPTEKGISVITAWMDAIKDHFPNGTILTSNTTKIYVNKIGRSLFQREENWFSGYISIYYESYN